MSLNNQDTNKETVLLVICFVHLANQYIHERNINNNKISTSIFIRPSKTGRIMFWPPSVRSSVRPLTFRVRSLTLILFKIFS